MGWHMTTLSLGVGDPALLLEQDILYNYATITETSLIMS